MKIQLTKLSLTNFRSHTAYSLIPHENFNVITGKNGAGKTNILEAISLLAPARGFRGATLSDLQKFAASKSPEANFPWSIFAEGQGIDGQFTIGTGGDVNQNTSGKSDKRIIKINGEQQRSQQTLTQHVSVQWLVPSQDQTFAAGGTSRREFLDRLTSFFFPPHDENLAKFNYVKSERKRLLERKIFDDSWLKSIELKMAEYATAIAASRLEAIILLQNAIDAAPESLFPKAMLSVAGVVEDLMQSQKALEAEGQYREMLKSNRPQDAESGRTNLGPHRSDFVVFHSLKNLPAELCSTGEQKALLLSITMASVRAKQHLSRITPILLLDEVIAHLDEKKRDEFFEVLKSLNAQTWLTGTEIGFFVGLKGSGEFFGL
jgi:DNA replication and repair protein RecF